MSLNDIKLPPYLVAKMYENSLIYIADNASPISNTTIAKDAKVLIKNNEAFVNEMLEKKIHFLGRNDKNILIIVQQLEHAFLGDDELSFLINILNACKISMQDVALINASNQTEVHYENINTQFAPKQILFFGVAPQQLNYPIQIPQYKIQLYNHQQLLCAPALQTLGSDKAEKMKLWVQLKVLFEV